MMETVNFRVMQDKVAVMPDPQETISPGGVHIPEMAKQRPVRGTIVAVGPGTKTHRMDTKVGDVVIYGRYSGTEITMDGDHADNRMEIGGRWALMMQERDVFAVERDGMLYPLSSRVLVQPAKGRDITEGGIHIPDMAKPKPTIGTVVQVGPGEVDKPMELAVGETVLHRKWEGTEVDVNGETMLLIRQENIIAAGLPANSEVVIGECFDD